jgi:hypothetical protein
MWLRKRLRQLRHVLGLTGPCGVRLEEPLRRYLCEAHGVPEDILDCLRCVTSVNTVGDQSATLIRVFHPGDAAAVKA